MEETWDFLLSEFRRLGGIADNVIQKEGETIFKSKWSSLEVDQKLKLPLGNGVLLLALP